MSTHTYTLTSETWSAYQGGEERTSWTILRDGKRADSYSYDTEAAAQKMADRMADSDALDARVESVIGQQYHYGIVITSEPRPNSTPSWRITDPHTGRVDYGFAHYSHTPPPVSVYTREQYEAACAAVDLEPAPDADLGNYADKYGDFSMTHYSALDRLTYTLRGRRMAGIAREEAAARADRARQLAETGLGDGPYSREQYEQACAVMQVPALPDSGCAAVVMEHIDRIAAGLRTVREQADEVTVTLARRRIEAMEAAEPARRCDECGDPIYGDAMIASLGTACGPDCYDAMSDRPGRYARSGR